MKLYESRPFGSKSQKNRQQKVNKSTRTSAWRLTSKNSSTIPYKHTSPQSRVFTHGLRAGHFTHQGEVNNMAECIQHCGQQPNCSAAFMVRQFCFTVECYSERSCDTAPAVDSGYNPKVAFIKHLLPPATSQPGMFLERNIHWGINRVWKLHLPSRPFCIITQFVLTFLLLSRHQRTRTGFEISWS
jgi:hypothetical protein